MFLLGVVVILDGLTAKDNAIPELIIGSVMVGVLPIENIVEAFTPRYRRSDARQ